MFLQLRDLGDTEDMDVADCGALGVDTNYKIWKCKTLQKVYHAWMVMVNTCAYMVMLPSDRNIVFAINGSSGITIYVDDTA